MTLFIDGFEQFKGEGEMQIALQRANYRLVPKTGIAPQAGRSAGGIGLQITNMRLSREAPWTGEKFAFGCAAFAQGRGTMLMFEILNTPMVVWLDGVEGSPMFQDKRGNSIPWVKHWYYLEVELNRTTMKADFYINGRAEVMGVDLPTAAASESKVIVNFGTQHPGISAAWLTVPENGAPCLYDDVYINDGGRLTPVLVSTRFATSSGPVAWDRSPEAPTNHEGVSMRPPKPLDVNVSSGAIGATDFYQSTDALPTGNAIVATGVCVLARKSLEFDAKLGVFVGDNVNLARRDASVSVSSGWATHYVAFPYNAGDTKAGLEAAPFGIQVVSP